MQTLTPPTPSRRRAFTLVELLVVVSIILVLIAILIPAIGGARNSARKTTTTTLMTAVGNAISQFKSQNNRLPGYFSQAELGNPQNRTGFTSMENALLDLAGGIEPSSNPCGETVSGDHIVKITINHQDGLKCVIINTTRVGASDGPGYLNMSAKGVGSTLPQASGLAPARVPNDQIEDTDTYSAGKFQMPDILDAWGRPIILWARNEAAGSDPPPRMARIRAPNNPLPTDPAGLFYWRANMGYLAAPIQRNSSALGGSTVEPNDEQHALRTMDSFLGDPAFPDPTIPASSTDPPYPSPLSPRGDFVLHSAGVDGVFLTNKGEATLEYRYLPAGLAPPDSWGGQMNWRTLDQTDDIFQAGS